MNFTELFPTVIGHSDLERSITKEELAFIKAQETKKNIGNLTSKDFYLLEKKELTDIKHFIKKCINEYFTTVYAPDKDVSLRITQSWSNYTDPGHFHHKHAHPNSFLSGVFFVQSDPSLDKIIFFKDQYQQILIHTKNFNSYNSDSWWLEAVPGRLLLFPSSLIHMVENVQTNKQRISISFNTFPVGYVGIDEELASVHLN